MRLAIALAAVVLSAAGLAGRAAAQDVDLMQYADTDMDGKVTPAEYAAFLEGGWNFAAQGAEKVKIADVDPQAKGLFVGVTPDADGVITKEAYLALGPERFKAADKNGDGVLDAAELNGSMRPPEQ